jgi:preprotein translocase subunit SecG
MNEWSTTPLAALVFAYALLEFLIKRVLRGAYDRERRHRRMGAWSDAAMLLALFLVSTAGVFNFRLLAGCSALAALQAATTWFIDRDGRASSRRYALERFLTRETVMVAGIFLVWRLALPLETHQWFVAAADSLLGSATAPLAARLVPVLLIVSSYLFMIDGGTRIVRGILDKFPVLYEKAIASLQDGKPSAREGRAENAGEWIGILERIVTLTFVFTGSFTAIAFALTAKSIARFRELENKSFAEYYLLGTIGSVVVALLAGLLVKRVAGF